MSQLYEVTVFGGLRVLAEVIWRGEDSEIGDIYWFNRHTQGRGNKFYNHLRDKVDDSDVLKQAVYLEPWDVEQILREYEKDKECQMNP